MAKADRSEPLRSDVYKAFFDDATLSDLTIHLSDRSVRVHRIVLCRRSEYFVKLLTGSFQESGCKEIELKEDDPEAMIAILRHMYELPFVDCLDDDLVLQEYADIYVAAEKYQVNGLKLVITEKMKHIVNKQTSIFTSRLSDDGLLDFIRALRTIVEGTTPHDLQAREVMAEACVANLRYMNQRPELLSLLRESADLGAAIVGHKDLEYGVGGAWVVESECRHYISMACPRCGAHFGDEPGRRRREQSSWACPKCEFLNMPTCGACKKWIEWIPQELHDGRTLQSHIDF